MSKDLVNQKEEIKCIKILKRSKMINFEDITKESIKEHNPNWSQMPDDPHKILINGGSGSGKINSLFNLISHQLHIDRTYYILKIHINQNNKF